MFNILDGREQFYQWDTNQKLIVKDSTITEVHFCNRTDDCALVCEVFTRGDDLLVNVPNILLQDNWPIRVYAYCSNYTKVSTTFKVLPRSKPADYVYTETEVKNWDALEARVNEKLAQVDELAEQAATSFESASAAVTEAYNASSAAWGAASDATLATQYIKENRVANALIGSASGELVVLDDVSPIAHEMAVSVRKKNLCNIASITGEENAAGDIKLHDIKKHGTYTASADITLYADDAATNPTFTVQVLYTDYTHSDGGYSSAVPKDGVTRRFTSTVTTDSTKEIKWVRIIALNYSTQSGRHAKAENIQLEEGATATPYAPYLEDVSGVKVKVLGKNLLDIHNRTKGTIPNGANTLQRKFETDKYYVGLTANNYCYDYNVTLAEYVEGVWRISNKCGGYGVAFPVEAKPNTSYYLTGVNGYIAVGFYDKDGNFIKHFGYVEDGASSFLTPANCAFITVCLVPISINTIVEYSNVQLEEGTTATEYEPYKEPITYAQGEPINSIYPATTLATDTVGAVVDVSYNKDTNKVISEIYKAIISLGGNV